MAYILKREKAISAVEDVIKQQDNDLLQRLYVDEPLVKYIGQAEIFKLWHGFIPVDSLSDKSLTKLLQFFGYNHDEYHEQINYSYLIEEYANTIENQNTRYLTQNSLKNFAVEAEKKFFNDLPLMTRDEAEMLVDYLLTNSSPATLQRAVTKVAAFCDWCIENQKIPGAVNNFKRMKKITYEPWVQRCLVRDAYDLEQRFQKIGLVYNEGRPAPILLALAWMGFTRTEVLDIKNEDVDLFKMTVCERDIPKSFAELFLRYEGGSREIVLGNNSFEMIQEDLGYYVKRQVRSPNGLRFDDTALVNSIFDVPFSYENIWLSGMLYRLYDYERDSGEPVTDTQISDVFQVTSTGANTRYKQIYAAYKKCFWENA